MNKYFNIIRKKWFTLRIFISLSIVVIITSISFLFFENAPTSLEIAGKWIGLSPELSQRFGYYLVSILVLKASLIRMWAGSILSSATVMSFKIQNRNLKISGPYNLVRNPIYFADLIAFTSLSLCLRPVGLLIPLLIGLHYYQLIKYEEEMLIARFGSEYREYINLVPAIVPSLKQLKRLFSILKSFTINFDGFRHNAQYILFIPGLVVAGYTGKFFHAILIALPAVIDWAVIHTIIGVSPDSPSTKKRSDKKKINGSPVFSSVLYAQCWEDPELDRIAFRIKPDDTVFTITSGGCNALAFLIDDPEKIICLDMNKYQNYLLSLKMSSFRILSYKETLEFFGIIPSKRRLELFHRIKPSLPEDEQLFWKNNKRALKNGIIHCGKYEKYMRLLKRIFRLLIGKKVIGELFDLSSESDRTELFIKRWDNRRWRIFCRIFLSRAFASMLFDKAFYRYLEPSFSFENYYRQAVRKAVTELPVQNNYFLAYILFGNYFKGNFPAYLNEQNYELIRKRIDRIKVVTSGCLEYFKSLPGEVISKFNFTNIFEWMSAEEFSFMLKETIRIAKDGAVVTYRNHLVSRTRPECIADQIIPDTELAMKLHARDRSFIYKAYVVERIKKSNVIHC
jgi:S-adenosylmethionine-diacylglycerol 3-amino-3-carboxypropyl transferase